MNEHEHTATEAEPDEESLYPYDDGRGWMDDIYDTIEDRDFY